MATDNNNKFYKKSMNQWVFNQMIYDERESNGFSQDEMGRLLKISGKTIHMYEMKKIKPSMDVIIEFLKVFNKKIFIVDRNEDITEFDLTERTETHFRN
jgi:DNA-binding XRE family transcriptional regulator